MKNFKELDSQKTDNQRSNFVLNKLSRKAFFMLLSCFLVLSQGFALDENSESKALDETSETKTVSESKINSNQGIVVTGTVSDIDGPLPGVNILVKGTSDGTQTDFDGNYSISVADSNAVLVFSYVGYKSQEIIVGNNSKVNVLLEADVAGLDEVIVVGYTTKKKGEVTGSVSTIKSEVLEQAGNKDLAKSLAGRATGLIISDRGGYPGSTDSADLTLLVRGLATLGNNSPLILIDNIPTSTFSHLAPQDIESLTVLKDGAAAIYGARAANGVILITTKRGKSGKPKINFSTTYNVSSFSEAPELMNSEQFAIYSNEIAERNGAALPFTQEQINNYAAGNDPINFPNTDWADLTFANSSPEYRNSLSISGGNDNVSYFVSGDAIKQVGMFRSGSLNFKQNQVRSNIDIKVLDNLNIGVDLSGRFGERNEPGVSDNEIYSRINTNFPTEVGVYPNGLPGFGGENGANPYVMATNQSGFRERIDNNLRARFSYDLNLDKHVKGLSIKGFAGIVRNVQDIKSWYTPWTVYQFQEGTGEYIPTGGFSQASGTLRELRENFYKYNEVLLNSTIHYRNTFAENHSISAFVGVEQSESNQRNFWVEKRGFPTDDHPELFAGDVDGQLSDGVSQEWARVNYFGSLSYDFMKKYFIDLTLRHDGSSNFGPGKRFGTFPSIGASWAIDKESFMDNVNWINSLRLRASWAKMGNDRIAPFQYLTRFAFGGGANTQPNSYIFGSPGQLLNGYTSANVPNPDITWETAYMRNIGLNFGMFDGKLTGDINYYYQKREDILVTRAAAIPDAAGLTLPAENIGKVDNWGLELELGWADNINENLSYNLGGNFTQAKNEVKFLAEAIDVPDALKREGKPLGSYVVYPTNGIFTDQAQVDATTAKLNGTVEGEPFYLDTNEDGSITGADRVRTSLSNVPEIQFGFFGGFKYKNFDLNFLFQGQANADVLIFFERPGARPNHLYNQRWTPDNRNARYPRAYASGDAYSGQQSTGPGNSFEGADFWLHDASFIRLKQLEIGYNITKDVSKFANIRLYVRGYNLATFFSDVADLNLDPEASGYWDFRESTYPSLKTFTFGLDFNF